MTEDDMGQRITDEIDADPDEVLRLRRARAQAREGNTTGFNPDYTESIKQMRRAVVKMWMSYGGDINTFLPGGFPITKEDLPLEEPIKKEASIFFSLYKPAWWRRNVVVLHMGGRLIPIMRSWSWDRADNLNANLNESVRRSL